MMEQWRSALFDSPRLRRMRFKETPWEELEWLVLTEDLELRHEAKLMAAGLVTTRPSQLLLGLPGKLLPAKENRPAVKRGGGITEL